MHQAAPDLEKKFYALFAQNIVVDAQAFGLIHDQFFFHVSFYEFHEFIVQNVFVLGVLLLFFVFTH